MTPTKLPEPRDLPLPLRLQITQFTLLEMRGQLAAEPTSNTRIRSAITNLLPILELMSTLSPGSSFELTDTHLQATIPANPEETV